MTEKYFAEYIGIEVKQFRDTLLQHMGNVKKSVAERTHHKRLYDRRVDKRQMHKQESKVDLGKALDADLVVMKSSGTKSGKQNTSSRSGNDADADNADLKPVYDKEPMAEPRTTTSTEVPTTDMIVMISMINLESLFAHLFDEYVNGENRVVSESSATVDASDKRQQQRDSTSSTSTLATTAFANGNFDV
ncbi:hypothetical protein Tco_0223456 [Tanacetum coccineum]